MQEEKVMGEEMNTPAEVQDEVEVLDENNIVNLRKPLNGKDALILDFSKITGATLLKCEKKAKEVDPAIIMPQLSMVYAAHVAAAAAGVRYDDIISLFAPDFTAVTSKVNRFLNGAD